MQSFNFQGDLKAVAENKDMAVSGSNRDYICRRDLLMYGFWGPISFLFAAESGRALGMYMITVFLLFQHP